MAAALDWDPYLSRYRSGEWRAVVFRDMVLADMRRMKEKRPTVLDIGCGLGFDGDARLQSSLSTEAGTYIGVEPDPEVELQPCFNEVHRCLFEDAPILPGSVDIAFAVMVLEHVESPDRFWQKTHEILREGGIFWGFTMDSRHWFTHASALAKSLRIKDWYLTRLHGRRGQQRYENYPVYYRTNLPDRIREQTATFGDTQVLNVGRVGQLDYFFPKPLRWIGRTLDRLESKRGLPGSLLAVRVQK